MKRSINRMIEVAVAMGSCLLASCSSSSTPAGPATSSLTSFAAGIVAVQKSMTQSAPRLTTDSAPTAMFQFPDYYKKLRGIFSSEAVASTPSSLSAIWATSGLMGNLYSNTAPNLTPQDWMEQATDVAFADSNGSANTVFGKFFLGTALVCVFGNSASGSDLDTDGLFKVGTYTKTVDLSPGGAAATACNIPASLLQGSGSQQVSITVTATVNQSQYTKLYEPNDGSDPIQPIYVKLDPANNIFHMMTVENYNVTDVSNCGSDYACPDRTIANIDGSVTTYEFYGTSFDSSAGHPLNGATLYRIYTDTSADVGYLLSSSVSLSGASITKQETFTMASKPSTESTSTGSVALSLVFQGETVTSPTDETADNDACVSRAGAILTDSTLSCDLTGTGVSGAAAAIAATNAAHTSYTTVTAAETTKVSFTGASDIYTATLSN